MTKLAVLAFSVGALVARDATPRIFLNSAYKTYLQAKVTANDSDWQAFKAQADWYAAQTYASYPCSDQNAICYTGGVTSAYQGNSWHTASILLGVAYQLTGDTTYSAKLKELLAAMRSSWDGRADCSTYGTSTIPPSYDGGYAWRSIGPALGWAYDWAYDQLTTQEKADATATAKCWYDYSWAKNQNQFRTHISTFNYNGGHLVGVGSLGYAMEGDIADAETWISYAAGQWTNVYGPSWSTGALRGGVPGELWQSYGYNHSIRMLQYVWMRYTAAAESVIGDIPARLLAGMSYSLQPSRWRVPSNVAGSLPSGVLWGQLPMFLARIADTFEQDSVAAKCMSLYNSLATTAAGIDPQAFTTNMRSDEQAIWHFLWAISVSPSDYTSGLAATYDEGNDYLFSRSDWTDSAHWSMFMYGTGHHAGHWHSAFGEVLLARGADALLINGDMWDGVTGDDHSSANQAPYEDPYGRVFRANSLWFDDLGTYLTNRTSYYTGGVQPNARTLEGFRTGIWAPDVAWPLLAMKRASTYAYAKGELTGAYDGDQWHQNATNRTLRHWIRSFAWLGDGFYAVYDRVLSKAATPSFQKTLFWHLPPNTSPSAWTAPTVDGTAVTSAAVGTSKLHFAVVSPAAVSVTQTWDPHTYTSTWEGAFAGSSSDKQVFRIDVNPSSPVDEFNPVTCFAAIGSSDTAPAISSLVSTGGNYTGCLVAASTPRVALFSADGTAQDAVAFTAAFTGTGEFLVTDLDPSITYAITLDGDPVSSANVVGVDGTLHFSGAAGAYVISEDGTAPAIAPTVTTTTCASGSVGVAYSCSLAATGDTPISWTIESGTLPAGLSLVDDAITGTPTSADSQAVTVRATNSAGYDDQVLTVTILGAGSGANGLAGGTYTGVVQ